MPISAEQWRVSIGLIHTTMPVVSRSIVQPSPWAILWEVLVYPLLLLMEWWCGDTQLEDNCMKAVASSLLMMSGDVETNPGPVDHLNVLQLADVRKSVWNARAKWYDLGLELRIHPNELDVITESNGGDLIKCFTAMLKMWLKRVDPKPTWSALAAALREPAVGYEQEAISIEKQHCVPPSSTSGSSGETTGNSSSVIDTRAQVQKSTAELELKFNGLRGRICTCICSTVSDVNVFRLRLINMSVSLHHEHQDFIKTKLLRVDPTTTIFDLLCELSVYCDFLNYTIVEHMVNEFGNEDSKREMISYVSDLKEFRKTTRVCDFVKYWPTLSGGKKAPESELRTFVVKMKKNWESCTLEDLEQLKATITHKFFLPSFLLILESVNKGSFIITWLIPEPVATVLREDLENTRDREFFKKYQIDSVAIDGQECYYSPMKKYAAYLRELYLSWKGKNLAPFKLAKIGKRELNQQFGKTLLQESIRGDVDDVEYEKSYFEEMQFMYKLWCHRAKIVLIVGAPGVGKTTYSLQLCQRWAQGEILHWYSLLVLLPLRDNQVKSAKTISDLFYHSNLQHEHVHEIEETQGEGVAVWLEGWDELDEDLRTKSSIFLDLTNRKILPNATVFVTSRPWASQAIRNALSEYTDLHVELLTTPKIQLDHLLREEKVSPSISHKFVEYTTSQPAIKAAMHTPITANIIAEVFEWSLETGSSPPTTTTQLYTAYVLKVIQQNMSTHYGSKELKMLTSFSDLSPDVNKMFLALCEIAYRGLLKQQLVFSDIPLHCEELGLMKEVKQFYSEDGGQSSYHFLHLTVQEFLAAFHISQLPVDEQRVLVSEHVLSGHFKIALRFLAGLTHLKFTTPEFTSRLLKDNVTVLLYLVFEADDAETVSGTLPQQGVITVGSERSSQYWTSLDMYVIGYCISHSNCGWRLVLKAIDDEQLEMFCKGVLSNCDNTDNYHGGYIAEFATGNLIVKGNLTSDGIHWFVQLPSRVFHGLKVLELENNKLDKAALSLLANIVPRMTAIEHLNLRANPIGNGGAVDLLNALYIHNTLRQLDLRHTGIGEKDITALSELLTHSHLEHLNIYGNDLSPDSVMSIMEGLSKNRTLKHLYIDKSKVTPESTEPLSLLLQQPECQLEELEMNDCNITSEGAITLSTGLTTNHSLRKLNLSQNPIGDDGAIAFGDMLSHNKHMRELDLSRCNITSKGAIQLATGLTNNSTLTELDISYNHIGVDGAREVSKMIKQNKSLEVLRLHYDDSVGNDGVQDIISSLTHNTTLRVLRLPMTYETETTDMRVCWY